ncbi:MAG: type II secretion system protein [Candidatus Pacebacteria bacterium]|nr:type II secretion system protein [Candidatus Paceibacterota bacterium]
MKINNKFQSGFTLTELLVAIAIVGILSSIVLTSMSGARDRAKDARRISDIKQIQLALEIYYDVNSSYPDAIYSGDPLADYVKISHDPNGDEYKYWGNGQNYHLGAVLQETNKLLDDDDDYSSPGGFNGDSSDCAGGAGADMCYDMTP